MGAGAFVPLGVFILVVGSVGWRLLALWRRTRQEPELLLGLALVLMSCVAMPLAGLGRVPSMATEMSGRLCFVLGIGTVGASVVLGIAFTQRVFRPEVGWARALFFGVSAALVAAVAWISWANFTGATVAEIVRRMRPGTLVLIGSMAACYAWSTCESFLYYSSLKRRLALGLADPVLVDRFFLWGISSGANTLLMGVLLYCIQSGMVLLREPLPLTAMAVIGSTMSAAWYLTFLAPEAYLDSVRRRAARA